MGLSWDNKCFFDNFKKHFQNAEWFSQPQLAAQRKQSRVQDKSFKPVYQVDV